MVENSPIEPFEVKLVEGIVHVKWCMEYYTVEDVERGIELRMEIQQDNSYPMFVDFTSVKSGSREARQRLSDKDSGKGITAVAVLYRYKVHTILFNFFHSIYKAPAPTKLFTNTEDALKWLEGFK